MVQILALLQLDVKSMEMRQVSKRQAVQEANLNESKGCSSSADIATEAICVSSSLTVS